MTDSNTQAKPFDFRKPCRLPVAIEHQLSDWQASVSSCAQERFAHVVPLETQWKALPPETAHPSDPLRIANAVGFLIHLDGFDTPTIFLAESTFALVLVQSLLGETETEKVEPRELTSVEHSLFELIVQNVVETASFAGADVALPEMKIGRLLANPRISRFYSAEDDLVWVRFDITGKFGTREFVWIWTEKQAEVIFAQAHPPPEVDSDSTERLKNVSSRIPFELVVRLGAARLHVSQLAELKEGDVIVLDRRVSDWLTASIQDDMIFQGWPGRVGNRQALLIESMLAEP